MDIRTTFKNSVRSWQLLKFYQKPCFFNAMRQERYLAVVLTFSLVRPKYFT